MIEEHDSTESPKTLTSRLVQEWRNLILTGQVHVGDQMPPERELCNQHGVSRVTVRKAMEILEQQGLIDRFQGRGSFIKSIPQVSNPELEHNYTGALVFIAWSMESSEQSITASAIDVAAKAAGYATIVWDYEAGKQDMITFVRELDPKEVKAVLWWPMEDPEYIEAARILQQKHIHIVCIDRRMEGINLDTVLPDHRGGTYQLTQHLIRNWAMPAYYFGMKDSPTSARDRFLGYCQAMQDAGTTDVASYYLPITVSETNAAAAHPQNPWSVAFSFAQKYIPRLPTPAAVVCGNDYIAYGLYLALKESGREFGVDIGFTGFQNSALGLLMEPKLTTAEQYRNDVASSAAKLAIRRINGMKGPPLVQVVPVQLVVRESSLRISTHATRQDESTPPINTGRRPQSVG